MVSSNCAMPQFPEDIADAFARTVAVAERARRSGGTRNPVLAHHVIQSFAPGEIDANEAHEVGLQFLQAIVGDDHDYVIATHLDRDHIHNHIMFNPVSRSTLKRYRMTRGRADEYREISNQLCAARGLSTTRKGRAAKRSLSLGGLYARIKGMSTTALLARKIDIAVQDCSTWQSMLTSLREMGVSVDTSGRDIKFVDPENAKYPVRGGTIGAAYTRDALMKRLGREDRPHAIVMKSLEVECDDVHARFRLPGTDMYVTVSSEDEYMPMSDRAAALYLFGDHQYALSDKRGNYAGTMSGRQLREQYLTYDLSPTAVQSEPIRRGLTRRQESFYRRVDYKVQKLHATADAYTLLREEYPGCPPDEALDSLRQRVDVIRAELDALILRRQEVLDAGGDDRAINAEISERTHELRVTRTAQTIVESPERKPTHDHRR